MKFQAHSSSWRSDRVAWQQRLSDTSINVTDVAVAMVKFEWSLSPKTQSKEWKAVSEHCTLHTMLCDVMSCHVIRCMSCHTMSCHVTACHSRHVVSCHVSSCCVPRATCHICWCVLHFLFIRLIVFFSLTTTGTRSMARESRDYKQAF